MVLFFPLILFGWILVIWGSLRAVKRRIVGWDRNSSIWFVMTINIRYDACDAWQRYGAYDADEAKIIVKYQYLCCFGMILSAFASVVVLGALTQSQPNIHPARHPPRHVQGAIP